MTEIPVRFAVCSRAAALQPSVCRQALRTGQRAAFCAHENEPAVLHSREPCSDRYSGPKRDARMLRNILD